MATSFVKNLQVCIPSVGRSFFAALFIFFFLTTLSGNGAYAAAGVPRVINHQGRLLDSSGNLLGGTGTSYCFRFSIYDDAIVGAPDSKLWPVGTPSDMTATVKGGVFNIGVGDTNAGGDVLDYNFQDNSAVYLNVDVASRVGGACGGGDESYENLAPRQRILASAFTLNASSVLGSGQSAIGTTTLTANAVLTLEATSTSAIPLFIKGFFGQIADLFRVVGAAGNQLLTFTNAGNLGIGTSSPGTPLSVTGAGVFTGPVTATYFVATSTTDISYFAGNLGVGTTSPTEQLSVAGRLFVGGAGTSTIENNLYVLGTLQTGSGSMYLTANTISGSGALNVVPASGSNVNFTLDSIGKFAVNGDRLVIDSSTGYVGIGTSSPYAQLSIAGNVVAGSFTGTTSATSTFAGVQSSYLDSYGALKAAATSTLNGIRNSGFITASGNINSDASITAGASSTFQGISTAYINGSGNLSITGAGTFGTTLLVSGTSTQNGITNTGFITTTGNINADNSGSFGSNLSVTGSTSVGTTFSAGSTTLTQLNVTNVSTSTFAGGIQTALLDVSSLLASSTFANGIQLSNGCFRMPNGQCAGAGSGTVTSGSLNTLSYYSAATTLDSAVALSYDTGNGRLGIGTSTPGTPLSVTGAGVFTGPLTFTSFSATSSTATSTIAGHLDVAGNIEADRFFATTGTSTFQGVEGTFFSSTGNLGVAGTANIGSTLSAGSTTITNLNVTNISTSTLAGGLSITSGCFAIGGLCVGGGSTASITIRTFTSNDTWNAPADLLYAEVIVTGGGGGGGEVQGNDTTNAIGAGGGGAGGTTKEMLTAAELGSSQSVTVGGVGAGGTGGGGASGNPGGDSYFGLLVGAYGGGGGIGLASINTFESAAGGVGAAASSTGDIALAGGAGDNGSGGNGDAEGGTGGSSYWGGGGRGGIVTAAGTSGGVAGSAYGSGGGGAATVNTNGATSGGSGASGVVIVYEY
ncbi:MAG: Tail fiber protein, partial [Parcubacteria group bacterium GW2011_GWA2_47_10]